MNPATFSPFVSLSLKVIGIITILSSLVDYIVLAIPFQPFKPEWQGNYITTIVDRGIVPMVGIAFLLVGYWIDGLVSSSSTEKKSAFLDLRLPVFILSSLLGLLFFLVIPLYLSNLGQASSTVLQQIQQGATQAEDRLQAQFEQLNRLAQSPQGIQQIGERIALIDKALASGQFQGQALSPDQRQQLQQARGQLQGIREVAKDPKKLEARLNELQNKLRDQKLERENLAKTEVFKRGLRIGLSSFLLAIGYIVIGWFGLRGTGSSLGQRRRA